MFRHHRCFSLVMVATVLCGGTGYAQRFGRFGSGMGYFGAKGGGIFFVASNEAVQQEIGVDGANAIKVKSIADQYNRESRASDNNVTESRLQLDKFQDLSREEREKRNKEIWDKYMAANEQLNAKSLAQLNAAVSAAQVERLQQITWQLYGSQAWATDRDLIKSLELTSDQIKRIVAINAECEKQRELRGQSPKTMREFEKERDAKAIEVLTEDQKTKFTKLKGQPFDLALLAPQRPRTQ